MIHRIRLVCCPSCGSAGLVWADELAEAEGPCCPSGAGEGVGASGVPVAATVCWEAGDGAGGAFSCDRPSVRVSKQIIEVITTRIEASAPLNLIPRRAFESVLSPSCPCSRTNPSNRGAFAALSGLRRLTLRK
jgi:hypothetical protein